VKPPEKPDHGERIEMDLDRQNSDELLLDRKDPESRLMGSRQDAGKDNEERPRRTGPRRMKLGSRQARIDQMQTDKIHADVILTGKIRTDRMQTGSIQTDSTMHLAYFKTDNTRK